MRTKEVKKAIKSLKNFVNQKYYNGVSADEMKTVLAYIDELEEKNRIQRCQLNDAFSNGFIHKDIIREKLKELEYQTLYVDGVTDKKYTTIASISCLMGKREVLKELLEED